MRKNFQKLLKISILILAYFLFLNPYIIAPLYFGFLTSKYFHLLFSAQLIIFLSLVLFILRRPKILKISPLVFILFSFLLVSSFASFFGLNPLLSFFGKFDRSTGLILLWHLFFLFILAGVVFKKRWWEEFFLLSVVVGASISIILIGTRLGLLDEYNLRSGITFGNSSFVATYLLFVFFFSLYLVLEKTLSPKIFIFERKETRFIGIIGLLTSGLALPLSGGRAASLSALLGVFLVFLFFLAYCFPKKIIKKLGKIALFLFFFSLLLFLIFFHWPESFLQKIFYPLMTKARFAVWQGSWEAFLERPIRGYGAETFELVYVKHFDPILFLPEGGGEVRFDKAHNIIFETLISGGIFALIFYLAIFLYLFSFLVFGFLKKKITFAQMSCFFALLLGYFLQNLVVFDTPTSYLFFFFVLGYLSFLDQKIEFLPFKITKRKILIIFLVVLIFLFSFYYLFFRELRASYLITLVLLKDLSSEERMEKFKEFEKFAHFGRFQAREKYALKIGELFGEGRASEEEMEFALSVFEKNIKENPEDYYSLVLLANLYNELGKENRQKLKRAETLLKKAIQISPKNLYGYWYLIQTKRLEGKYKEALFLAEKALEIEPKEKYTRKLYQEIKKEIKQ